MSKLCNDKSYVINVRNFLKINLKNESTVKNILNKKKIRS